jgi:hypothetical protein
VNARTAVRSIASAAWSRSIARTSLAIPGSEAIAPRLAAGWPGERMTAAAVTKRLHTAIWTLRKTLGLEGVLRMS